MGIEPKTPGWDAHALSHQPIRGSGAHPVLSLSRRRHLWGQVFTKTRRRFRPLRCPGPSLPSWDGVTGGTRYECLLQGHDSGPCLPLCTRRRTSPPRLSRAGGVSAVPGGSTGSSLDNFALVRGPLSLAVAFCRVPVARLCGALGRLGGRGRHRADRDPLAVGLCWAALCRRRRGRHRADRDPLAVGLYGATLCWCRRGRHWADRDPSTR